MVHVKSQEALTTQLRHKERSIDDLIRFVETRTANVSNFALLFGAGCSVTSGIRSAATLIEEWIRDIFKRLPEKEGYPKPEGEDINCIRDWLMANQMSWYNKEHEYSCLFEKRYDLPSQRRAFVETEVADKIPSLGYAYLIRLIEKGYFNTVFTTNFDDLLNEAFHLFSGKSGFATSNSLSLLRPIICAHDSSVRSVSISSPRPKIIKLHGDYLFDDIKSTLRETESLEENIRDKFVEFCKEFGLIVVGYAGNDRSVMDVINYLLKSDDYLKNGLYWCIRRGDEISDDLNKLLWKDKVYYVYIDGFDELFARLYHDLVSKDETPVTEFSFDVNNSILKKLSSNKALEKSKSEVIARDIKRLGDENRKNSFLTKIKDKFFKDNLSGEHSSLSYFQTLQLLEIDKLIERGNAETALEEISKVLTSLEGGKHIGYQTRLLQRKADALELTGRIEESLITCDKIIDYCPSSAEGYFIKNKFERSYKDKIETLRAYVEKYPYSQAGYSKLTDLEYKLISRGQCSADLMERLLKDLNNGIECNPSSGNGCYITKFDLLLDKKEALCVDWEKQAKEIIEVLKKQNPLTPTVFNMRLDMISKEKNVVKRQTAIQQLWEEVESVIETKRYPFVSYLGVLISMLEKDIDVKHPLTYIRNGIDKEAQDGNFSTPFAELAAQFYIYWCNDIAGALKFMDQISVEDYDFNDMQLLILMKDICRDEKLRERIDEIFKKALPDFSKCSRLKLELEMREMAKDMEGALRVINELKRYEKFKDEYFTNEMHILLWKGEFQRVYDEMRSPDHDEIRNMGIPADKINYQIARQKTGRKVQMEKIGEYLNDDDSEYKIATLILDGKKEEAAILLERIARKDGGAIFSYRNQYIFEQMGGPSVQRVLSETMKRRFGL